MQLRGLSEHGPHYLLLIICLDTLLRTAKLGAFLTNFNSVRICYMVIVKPVKCPRGSTFDGGISVETTARS